MAEQETPQDIIPISSHEQELMLFEASVTGVIDEVIDQIGLRGFEFDKDFRVLWAEGNNAREIPPKRQTVRQRSLVQMTKVLPAMRKVIGEGLVTDPADAGDLGSALMAFEGSPTACLRYLRGSSNSLVAEPIKPRELINILAAYQAILDVTPTEGEAREPIPSLASVIRSAQDWGFDLAHPLTEADIDNVHASIEEYTFLRTVSRATATGEPFQTLHEIAATSQRRNPIGFTAMSADDIERDDALEHYMTSNSN